MKLVDDSDLVFGSNNQTKKKFTIQASSKAFSILSDKLYKNKIRAVVRELSCNCIDAHYLNDNMSEPFHIKAPNRLDPRFIIRDFGPGMSDEDVMNLYTTYFASTKTSSNDYIGALGLGSKSPFSYTNTFSVVSYHEGVARGYTAVLSGGEPDLRPTFVEPMAEGEKTGLEITIPVKPDDIGKWHTEISYVLRPFGAVPPVVTGADIQVNYFPVDETNWFTGSFGYESSGLYAVYGKIVYPITLPSDVKIKNEWILNRYGRVYIHFPLGDLDITPSREELSLDEATLENIVNRVNALEEQVLTEDIAELELIENKRELTRKLQDFSNSQQRILNSRKTVFQGKTIQEWEKEFSHSEIQVLSEKYDFYVYQVDSDTKRRKISYYGNRSTISCNRLFDISCKTVRFMIDDKPARRAATFRGMYYIGEHMREFFVMVDPNKEEDMKLMALAQRLFAEDEVVILKASDMEDARKKDLEVNAPDKRDTVKPKSPNANRWYWNPIKLHWNSEDLFLSAQEVRDLSGYAIGMSRQEVRTFPEGNDIFNIDESQIRNVAEAIGVKEFYVIRPGAMKNAVQSELESLDELITDKFISLIDKVDYDEYVPASFNSNRVIQNIKRYKKLEFMLKHFTTTGILDAVTLNTIGSNLYSSSICATDDNEKRQKLMTALHIYRKLTDNAGMMFKTNMDEFRRKYPAIEYILGLWNIEAYVDNIEEIMLALDASNN